MPLFINLKKKKQSAKTTLWKKIHIPGKIKRINEFPQQPTSLTSAIEPLNF
jgi:hypothetical protein